MNLPPTDSRAQRWLEHSRQLLLRGFALVSPFSILLIQSIEILANVNWLASLARRERRLRARLPLILPLCAFLAASLLSAVFARDQLTAFIGLRSAWLPIVFFLVCVNTLSRAQASQTTRILIGAGGVAAAYGLAQTVTNGTGFRVHGTFGHYMTFAGVVLLIVLVALGQGIFQPGRRQKAWILGTVVLMSAALLMTQTRSAWLGLVAGSVALLWCWKRWYVLALPILLVLVLFVSPAPVKDRALSLLDMEDITMLERFKMWNGGWNIFRAHPLTGAGPDNLPLVYAEYKDPRESREYFTHLHSNVVQIAAERGAIGLITWLWIWVAYFRSVAGIYRRSSAREGPSKALIVGSLAAVIGFLVAGLFECNYRDSEVASLTYFVMALPFCSLNTPDASEDGAPIASG